MTAPAGERKAIEDELLGWMEAARRSPWPIADDEERFATLALRLFAFQFAACPPYARFCRARGVEPAGLSDWRAIPAVPTGAFKEVALRCFAPEDTLAIFRTSGTSGGGDTRGQLFLDDLALYQASLMASLDGLFLPDLAPGERVTLRILAPSPDEADDSSLSHMFGRLVAERGDAHSGFDVVDGALRADALDAALDAACGAGRPVALAGTAFAFVHWLDHLASAGRRFELPAGSRVMETGGFKGRSRELPRAELVDALSACTGVAPTRIVNQYGMTELGSQFYDSVLREPGRTRRKLVPPWVRVRSLDPESGRELPLGQVGALAILDLANTGSICAIQTADLGRLRDDGFEVIGREPDAEARGCSIAADQLLTGAPA